MTLYRSIQLLGGHLIKRGQVSIDHDPMSPNQEDATPNPFRLKMLFHTCVYG